MNKLKLSALSALAFSLLLFSCKNSGSTGANTEPQTIKDVAEAGHPVTGRIAFVNIDSLINNYDMYKDMSAKYREKREKVERDLEARGKSFQRDYNDLMDKANKGLLLRSEIEEKQAKLQARQTELERFQQTKGAELMEEETVMINKLQYTLGEYLKVYNKDFKYDMILSTTASGPVLNANPATDITAEVLAAMNELYKTEKKTEGAAATE